MPRCIENVILFLFRIVYPNIGRGNGRFYNWNQKRPFILYPWIIPLHMEYRQTYKELLANVSAVTRNESSDSVNGILDTVSVSEDLRMVSRAAHNTHTHWVIPAYLGGTPESGQSGVHRLDVYIGFRM